MADENKTPEPAEGLNPLRELIREATAIDPVTLKPGYKTTEFWLHVAGFVVAVALGYYGAVHDNNVIIAIAAGLGISNQASYSLGRSLVKRPTRRIS